MQSVLPFQFLGNGHAAFVAPAVVYLAPVLGHLHRHDMDMLPSDVGMLEYDIRLSSPAHALHVGPGYLRELPVVEAVFGSRVERHVHDGFFRPVVRGHPAQEVFCRRGHVEAPIHRLPHDVGQQYLPVAPIDFLLVVRQRAVHVFSGGDIGYHRCLNSSESDTTCCPTAASSRVALSSL